jgi:hypothetical protein
LNSSNHFGAKDFLHSSVGNSHYLRDECASEAKIHEDFLVKKNATNTESAKPTSSPRKPAQEDRNASRATQFKPLILALDKEERAEIANKKRKAGRADKVNKARTKPTGWMAKVFDKNASSSEVNGSTEDIDCASSSDENSDDDWY